MTERKQIFNSIPGRISAGVDTHYGDRKLRRAILARGLACVVAIALVLIFEALLPAQTSFRFYAKRVDNGQPAPAECQDEARILAEYINSFPHPDSWTWIIACDEESWRALEMRLGVLAEAEHKEIFAETDRHYHRTFIRGYTLLHALVGMDMSAQHIVAHELAHAVLDSGDERAVDDQAMRWIDERKRSKHLLVARQ